MNAPVIETVAKYFYFLTLNEQLTFAAGIQVLSDLKSQGLIDKKEAHALVRVLHKWKDRLPKIVARDWAHYPDEAGFELPEGFKVEAWRTFLTSADAVEIEALVLSRILGFTDDAVADGLGVSVGTVRYRVGRGLRHLGGYLES